MGGRRGVGGRRKMVRKRGRGRRVRGGSDGGVNGRRGRGRLGRGRRSAGMAFGLCPLVVVGGAVLVEVQRS